MQKMVFRNHSKPGHIAVRGIVGVFLGNPVKGINGQDRAGIGILGDIVSNPGICLTKPHHTVNIAHTAVDGIGKKLQVRLCGLNQTAAQISTKQIKAYEAD